MILLLHGNVTKCNEILDLCNEIQENVTKCNEIWISLHFVTFRYTAKNLTLRNCLEAEKTRLRQAQSESYDFLWSVELRICRCNEICVTKCNGTVGCPVFDYLASISLHLDTFCYIWQNVVTLSGIPLQLVTSLTERAFETFRNTWAHQKHYRHRRERSQRVRSLKCNETHRFRYRYTYLTELQKSFE